MPAAGTQEKRREEKGRKTKEETVTAITRQDKREQETVYVTYTELEVQQAPRVAPHTHTHTTIHT